MRLKKITLFTLITISPIFLTTSCSLDLADRDEYAKSSATDIYNEANTHLEKGRFEPAVKSYEALETHFPFGDITTKGQLEIIYAYYKDLEYLQSITAAERFLRLHPVSEYADYAFYLKGIAYFEQGTNMLSRWIATNPALRDTTNYKFAFDSFNKLINDFPKSPYAKDARARMVYIRNILAEHEYVVADYYMRREAFLAAANRARYIIEHLPNTPAESKAVKLLEESYARLNLTPLLNNNLTAKQLKNSA